MSNFSKKNPLCKKGFILKVFQIPKKRHLCRSLILVEVIHIYFYVNILSYMQLLGLIS